MKSHIKIYILLLFVLILASCSTKFDRNIFNKADMIIVELYNEHDASNSTSFKITNKNEILEYSSYISTKGAPFYKCGYDGKMSFYKNGAEFMDMEFNLTKECRHIVLIQNDNSISKKLSDQGYEHLKALQHQSEKP